MIYISVLGFLLLYFAGPAFVFGDLIGTVTAMIGPALLRTFSTIVRSGKPIPGYNPQPIMTPLQIIQRYDYPSENHFVTTEDGYILNVIRIPHGLKSTTQPRIPVLLLHGVTSSSADWVCMGPKRSLAFLLAERGYDVWMLNHRGNTFSRNHTTLDPDYEEFWRYSFHEHGYYDIPAAIDYILAQTKQSKLFYAGHSQGTSSIFACLTSRPEYNDKIRMVAALSPEVFFGNQQNQFIRMSSLLIDDIVAVIERVNLFELIPNRVWGRLLNEFCLINSQERLRVCMSLMWALAGYSENQMGYEETAAMMMNWPAGASAREIMHFGQLVNSKRYCWFDHGEEKNVKVYGQPTPPDYDLGLVTAPVVLIHGNHDLMGDTVDVMRLYKELKNEKHMVLIKDRTFNHVDILVGKDTVEVAYKKLFDLWKEH